MAGSAGTLYVGLRADTVQFQRDLRSAAKFANVALKGMAAAASAFGTAAAAQEKQWSHLASTILVSFAAGGPVLGAISLAGAAVGLVLAEIKKADEAAEEAAKKAAEEQKRLQQAMETTDGKLRRLRFDLAFMRQTGREPRDEERALALLREDMLVARDELEAERALYENVTRKAEIGSPNELAAREPLLAAQQRVETVRALIEKNQQILTAEEEIAKWSKERAQWEEATAQWMERQLEMAGSLRTTMEELANPPGERLGGAAGLEVAGSALGEPNLEATATEQVVVAQAKTFERYMEANWQSFQTSIGPEFSQFFADAIVDGFRTGFKNIGDMATSFLSGLASTFLQLGTMSILGPMFPGIFPKFAEGGFVRGPTLALVGEGGPEYIVPADKMGAMIRGNGGVDVGGIHVTVNGATDPVRTGEMVTDAIRREIRGSRLRRLLRGGG